MAARERRLAPRIRARGLRQVGGDRSGASAIEFALVAPLFLLIVFGTVVFSIYLATWLSVSHAAGEGARASVAGLTATERQTLALSRIQAVISGYSPLLDSSKVQVTYPTAAAGMFSVQVTYPMAALNLARYSPLAPIPSIAPSRTATVTTGGY